MINLRGYVPPTTLIVQVDEALAAKKPSSTQPQLEQLRHDIRGIFFAINRRRGILEALFNGASTRPGGGTVAAADGSCAQHLAGYCPRRMLIACLTWRKHVIQASRAGFQCRLVSGMGS